MTQPISVRFSEPVERDASVDGIWHGITSGALRVVNWYDHDGRRYLVARPVAPEKRARLTARQQKALALRSTGSALKVIAMELGISLTTASREVEAAMQVLGFDSTASLAAVLGHVAA